MEGISLVLTGYLVAINIAGFLLMGKDKAGSRKNNVVKNRISEGLLFFMAIVGGSVGMYAGMFLFRHKTQKMYFLIGIPLLIIQQILFVYFAFSFFHK